MAQPDKFPESMLNWCFTKAWDALAWVPRQVVRQKRQSYCYWVITARTIFCAKSYNNLIVLGLKKCNIHTGLWNNLSAFIVMRYYTILYDITQKSYVEKKKKNATVGKLNFIEKYHCSVHSAYRLYCPIEKNRIWLKINWTKFAYLLN